jgi:hypothetical protein
MIVMLIMKKTLLAALLALSTLQAAEMTGGINPRKPSKLYYASIAALVAANALDIHSSLGRYERNPALQDSTGRFSPARGVVIKASLSTAILGSQFLIRKLRRQQDDKGLAVVNLTAAGVVTGVAIHNHTVPK